MTIPLAFAAFLYHASTPTFFVAIALGCIVDWHLDYLIRLERC